LLDTQVNKNLEDMVKKMLYFEKMRYNYMN